MKQVCLLCERTSPDKNLFCQETYCPTEMSPTILDYGDWFGDIEIVKPVIVLRSAVLYVATHQKKKVFMKVAHPGTENKERLKREAEFLQWVQLKNKQLPTLPSLLPPYASTTVARDPYGKMMLQGHLLYFYLFDYFEGEPLRDVLVKNPQLWINHVGWIMISLASTVNFLHVNDHYHYALSPDSLLVRFDDESPAVPRVLLFDLGLASSKNTLANDWYSFFVQPAYTAPELVSNGSRNFPPNYRTDVYGLGLVMYEMLVGKPAFPYRLRSDTDVYKTVLNEQRTSMNRINDVEKVAQIATVAVDANMGKRQQYAADVAEQLKALFGDVPPPKKRKGVNLNTLFVIIAVVLVVAFLIALAVSLTR